MFDEDDLLPISALSHLVFCERRAALIHLERIWRDNSFTVEGTHLHEIVDEDGRRIENRDDLRLTRGIALRSLRLGVGGQADVVEYHRAPATAPGTGWLPTPIEYKQGGPKPDWSDKVQLCAQALCLEEMHGASVQVGALYYYQTRRRLRVEFDAELRRFTEQSIEKLRHLIESRNTPAAVLEPKCIRCSLAGECLPDATASRKSASRYLARVFEEG